MMYWITIPIALVALAVFGAVLFRHWKEIRLLDPDSIKEERLRQKREQIIMHRFERMQSAKFAPLKALWSGAVIGVKKIFHAGYIRLVQIDRFYKQAKSPFATVAPSTKERIKLLLDEGRSLARDLKWSDAERRYLEVLTLDNRNVDAYKGLGLIYLKQKLYPQAKETFEFLVKTKKADDICCAGLGEIAEAEGDYLRAEEMYQKALEVQPRSAFRHAGMAEYYLRRNAFAKAWPFAVKATELEPKSPKFTELSVDVAIKMGDREEARRRYDQLRLLSEDRQKLQSIKDHIDEMKAL